MDQNKLIKYMTIACVVMSVMLTSFMGVYVSVRAVDGDAVQDVTVGTEIETTTKEGSQKLIIPLKKGYNPDDIIIEQSLLDKTMSVFVGNVPIDFYQMNQLRGEGKHVSKIKYGAKSKISRLDIALDGIYEGVPEFLEDALLLDFVEPKELFPHIIVINPSHGGYNTGTVANGVTESDVNLKLAMKVKEKLETMGYGVYMTREDASTEASADSAKIFQESVFADMVLELHCSGDLKTRTTKGYSVWYNGNDELSKSVAESAANSFDAKLFIENTGSKRDLKGWLGFYAGYLTNRQDAMRLTDDNELGLIADKLAKSINNILESVDNNG